MGGRLDTGSPALTPPPGGATLSSGAIPFDTRITVNQTQRESQDPRSKALVSAFRDFLGREGLKTTRQRELIAAEFALVEDHVSVEELLARVRKRDASIGYATVYRTLKLLVDGGLASLRNFGEGFARYEPVDEHHHDHLICEVCQKIVEFHDDFIEKRQEEVARELGFDLTHHRHELFGVCPDCLEQHGPRIVDTLKPRPNEDLPEDLPSAFRGYLSRTGLKTTRQRDLIVELFADVEDHVSVEDLLARVKQEDSSIGYATVYRTLKLLVESGLAACRHFGDGFTRFEPRDEQHHDHLIDEDSGDVVEFHDDAMERRQVEIAAEHGFALVRHRQDLFGVPRKSS